MSRVVMFVFNDCRNDSRVLREAEALADAGHAVTIIARGGPASSASVEREHVGTVEIVRVPVPDAWRARWSEIVAPWRAHGVRRIFLLPLTIVRLPFHLRARRRRRPSAAGAGLADWAVAWRWATLGWARLAASAAPRADVYHGHDLTGLPAALAARKRDGGLVVYDSHELFVESGSNARRPRAIRALLGRIERRWARDAVALITVNDSLAAELGRRLRPRRTVVVRNCPPRWTPPAAPPDLLRRAAAIPAGAPLVLYHGGFSPDRGLGQLMEAILEPGLERVHLVLMGGGGLGRELEARAAEARFGGRVHLLPPVPPGELPTWVASADVGAMPNQPTTRNERLSTPNKLFECLAAGVPVVSSDFPERRAILIDDPDGPLGAVCDPTEPGNIAAAIRSILELDPAAASDLRARCLRAAHARWNWEAESSRLVSLYDELLLARRDAPPGDAPGARQSSAA